LFRKICYFKQKVDDSFPKFMTNAELTDRRKISWLNILGFLVGCIGIGLSIYFYLSSRMEREPFFIVDPERTFLIDTKKFPQESLKVIREDGTPVKGDVTSVRFYFWNKGRQSIRQENVLEPLIIYFDDPTIEILDYKFVKKPRESIVLPTLIRNIKSPRNQLTLSFRILENLDGLSGQIIYAGDTSTHLYLSGTIEGTKNIANNLTLSKESYKKVLYVIFIGVIIAPMVFSLIFLASILILTKIRFFREILDFEVHLADLFQPRFRKSIIFLLIALMICSFSAFLFSGAYKKAEIKIFETIPTSLRQ